MEFKKFEVISYDEGKIFIFMGEPAVGKTLLSKMLNDKVIICDNFTHLNLGIREKLRADINFYKNAKNDGWKLVIIINDKESMIYIEDQLRRNVEWMI